MIGNQRVKQRYQKADTGSDTVLFHSAYQIAYTKSKDAHLKKGIKGKRNQHTAGERVADMVEKLNEKGVHPGMMIAVRDNAQHLLKLIDAVRGHDARILIEKIRKPESEAKQKCAEGRMPYIKGTQKS